MSWIFNKNKEKRNCPQQQEEPKGPEAEALTFLSLLRQATSSRSLSAVYGCIEIISNAIASIPLRVMQEDETGHRTVVGHHPL